MQQYLKSSVNISQKIAWMSDVWITLTLFFTDWANYIFKGIWMTGNSLFSVCSEFCFNSPNKGYIRARTGKRIPSQLFFSYFYLG